MRQRIEETFGWMKPIGGLRKTRYRGRARVQMHAYLVATADNLLKSHDWCRLRYENAELIRLLLRSAERIPDKLLLIWL